MYIWIVAGTVANHPLLRQSPYAWWPKQLTQTTSRQHSGRIYGIYGLSYRSVLIIFTWTSAERLPRSAQLSCGLLFMFVCSSHYLLKCGHSIPLSIQAGDHPFPPAKKVLAALNKAHLTFLMLQNGILSRMPSIRSITPPNFKNTP